MFGLSVWLRAESGFQDFVDYLDIDEFYIGVYLLIFTSVIVMIIAFVGCGAALMEYIMALYAVSIFYLIYIMYICNLYNLYNNLYNLHNLYNNLYVN